MRRKRDENEVRPENRDHRRFRPRETWVCAINEEAAIEFHESVIEAFEDNPYKPMVIYIDSYGGEVDALFSMLDTMDIVRSIAPPEFKFLTVAKGKAQSAGAVLLSYGDVRFATPLSRIMIHQVVGGSWGSHPENEVEFKEIARMNAKLLEILRIRSSADTPLKDFKDALAHNMYLTPDKAQEFGIIDVIGYPQVLERSVFDVRVLGVDDPSEKEDKKDVSGRSNKSSNPSKAKAKPVSKPIRQSSKRAAKRRRVNSGEGVSGAD